MSDRLDLRWIVVAVLAVGPAWAAVSVAGADEAKSDWKEIGRASCRERV